MEVALPAATLRDTVDSIDWSYMRAADLSRLTNRYQEARPAAILIPSRIQKPIATPSIASQLLLSLLACCLSSV